MLEINEVEILSKSLYTILKVEGLFQKSNFHTRYTKQLLRIGQQFNVLRRKEHITNNYVDEYIKWNSEKTPDPSMTKYECFIEINTLLCSFGLTHYEFLKRFFLETLFLDKLSDRTNKTISTKSTYGVLVKSFKNLPNFNAKMQEMLDDDLRNALAHDTWYFEDDQMRYVNFRNELVKIPLAKIPQKINIIGCVYSTITRNYFEEFEPESIKFYEEVGSNFFNKIFPLYGMDED